MEDFIKNNSKWLLTLVFASGLLYGQIQQFQGVEERLNRKIQLLYELTLDIDDLENRIIVLETKNLNNENIKRRD